MPRNSGKRFLALGQLQVELKGKNVIICNTQLHVWLKKMGSRVKKHRMVSALSFEHRKAWVDFVLDQASRFRTKIRIGRATIHIDDAWFCLIRDGHSIRMLPGKEGLGSIKLQHKSHVPKVIFSGKRSSFLTHVLRSMFL